MIGSIGRFNVPRPAAKPTSAVQFSGLHPNAVIGMEVKVAGTQNANQNTRRLWFKLKNSDQVEPYTYKTQYPLVLVREPKNEADPNAIMVLAEADRSSIRRKVGYVPQELARNLAPLMDQGHQFAATLTKIRPYKKDNEWFHALDMRMEYITKPNRAPNDKVRQKVEQAFEQAVQAQQYKKVLRLQPEEVTTHTGTEGKLVERVDHEQGTISYYRKGYLLANFKLNAQNAPTPTYERPKLPEALKGEIKRLLDRRA